MQHCFGECSDLVSGKERFHIMWAKEGFGENSKEWGVRIAAPLEVSCNMGGINEAWFTIFYVFLLLLYFFLLNLRGLTPKTPKNH